MSPLREEKYAQTKINILNAFLDEINEKSLNDVSVKEICKKVRISEGTFFNYFPSKIDVIIYYVQIWSIKVKYHLTHSKIRGIEAIYKIFDYESEEIINNHAVLREITAEMSLKRSNYVFQEIIKEEYELLFPRKTDIESIKGTDVGELFTSCILEAVNDGEILNNIDVRDLLVDILTIFFATHVTVWQLNMDISQISKQYKRQLDAIFKKNK